jgi:eukaryotic-like serine/threonine-protein kinase
MVTKSEGVVVGDTALGRFRLLERIGAGGFGTVYRGWDERLERPVAVKVIEAAGGASRRVLREAQAAARLNHPGIVTLYELGERNGHALLVSELVEGTTVDELAAEGRLSDRDVAEIGADLCDALAHAHSHGVVHRDIKPQNVIVREGPVPPGSVRAKVMDFGTASLVDAPGLTATGEVIGTIAYMAPEQAEGKAAGPPADAYAMALTLYECWSGRHPFIRATPAATARAIGEPVARLAEHRHDLPDRLCELIDACLVAQPEHRPGLEELGHGLDRVAPRLSAEDPVPVPGRRESLLAAPSEPAVAIARIGLLAAISALVAWLGLVAGRPGAALVAGLLLLPAPLLLQAPAGWWLPALAPVLGAIGVAPVYPALAALARSTASRAALAALGWAWLVAAEAVTGSRLLFETAEPAPDGWSGSIGGAATHVLAPILAPESLLVGAVWIAGAVVLGALIRGRIVALELLGVLVWAAGLVAFHDALAPGVPEPAAGPLVAALFAVAAAALWARTTRGSARARDVGRDPPLP